jgi:hypothetical protein
MMDNLRGGVCEDCDVEEGGRVYRCHDFMNLLLGGSCWR